MSIIQSRYVKRLHPKIRSLQLLLKALIRKDLKHHLCRDKLEQLLPASIYYSLVFFFCFHSDLMGKSRAEY